MTTADASRIMGWEPRWQQGAIEVVRAVFDEYHFTWDAEDYHRDLFSVAETYLRRVAVSGCYWRRSASPAALARWIAVMEW